MWLGR